MTAEKKITRRLMKKGGGGLEKGRLLGRDSVGQKNDAKTRPFARKGGALPIRELSLSGKADPCNNGLKTIIDMEVGDLRHLPAQKKRARVPEADAPRRQKPGRVGGGDKGKKKKSPARRAALFAHQKTRTFQAKKKGKHAENKCQSAREGKRS